jgi:hypothetical protein
MTNCVVGADADENMIRFEHSLLALKVNCVEDVSALEDVPLCTTSHTK